MVWKTPPKQESQPEAPSDSNANRLPSTHVKEPPVPRGETGPAEVPPVPAPTPIIPPYNPYEDDRSSRASFTNARGDIETPSPHPAPNRVVGGLPPLAAMGGKNLPSLSRTIRQSDIDKLPPPPSTELPPSYEDIVDDYPPPSKDKKKMEPAT